MRKEIPKYARLVFKGTRHEVYQWDEEMFDGTRGIFEAVKRKDGVTIVAIVGDKVMVNIEEQPFIGKFLGLPAGEVDGEILLEDAKRELLEETGYVSDDWEHWFTSEPKTSARLFFDNHFFIARKCRKVGEPTFDSGERVEVVLRTFDEFISMWNNPDFRNIELAPILEEAALDETKKKELRRKLFGE
jgi:ADP-ribose pyrophosphatase